jgi:hypothetical protein
MGCSEIGLGVVHILNGVGMFVVLFTVWGIVTLIRKL